MLFDLVFLTIALAILFLFIALFVVNIVKLWQMPKNGNWMLILLRCIGILAPGIGAVIGLVDVILYCRRPEVPVLTVEYTRGE